MVERQVALLRGINVGGKHIVPMTALAQVFAGLGCVDVKTYIQSGNVVFTSPAIPLRAEAIGAAIDARFGFAVPVVVRDAAEMARVIAASPFAGADAKQLHVVFLSAPLQAAQVAGLRALLAGEEQLAAHGSELYLQLPDGGGRSKLAIGCVGTKLPRTNTMRNWATVLKLAAMLAG